MCRYGSLININPSSFLSMDISCMFQIRISHFFALFQAVFSTSRVVWQKKDNILIHSATPKPRPVVIIIFAHVTVRTSVTSVPTFQISQNKHRLNIMIATGRNCGFGRGDQLMTHVLFFYVSVETIFVEAKQILWGAFDLKAI